jgi:alpha-tubulin suppressor-like RCC1 family protein
VKCWGSNGAGTLGLGDTAGRGDGAGEMGDSLPAVALGTGRTAAAITAGIFYTCALLDDATVKCWGENSNGQLGLGSATRRGDGPGEMGDKLPAVALGTGRTAVAITAGSYHACALLDDGTVKCWGNNSAGALGLGDDVGRGYGPGQMGDDLPAVALVAARATLATSAGDAHTCAVLDDGTSKCWGNNGSGRLGLGDTRHRGDQAGDMGGSLPALALGTGRSAVAIDAGAKHTCAILDDASVKCWGDNGSGRLGLGDTDKRGDAAGEMGESLPAVALGTGRTAVAISAGDAHSCAILDDGTVKCWGNNGSGRLGLGDTAKRGDAAGEMGDSLPTVALGTGRTAVVIDAGAKHTCAILDDGTVKCWGDNGSGRLGLGDTAKRGDAAGEMGDSLPAVALGTGRTVVAISVGDAHTCAILDDGTVKCWGDNGSGRLGLGDTAKRGDAAGEMGDNLPAVALGTGRTAVAIDAGAKHTCAILDDGTVKCWGDNGTGRLGLGDTAKRGDAAGEMGDSLPTVALGTGRSAVAITAGDAHTCAVLDDATVKCWGNNGTGRLGLGDTAKRGDSAGEMGDSLPAVRID